MKESKDWKTTLAYGSMFMITAEANQAGFWMLLLFWLLMQLAPRD